MIIFSLNLVGCDKIKSLTSKKIDCGDEKGTTIVKQMLNENTEKSILALNDSNTNPAYRSSEVRATLAQMPIKLENIRTSKTDPNSTKVFCVANVTTTLPTDAYNTAKKGLELLTDGSNVEKTADQYGLKSNANVFSVDVDYDLQPTDDGKNVFAHLENSGPIESFLSDITTAIISKPKLEQQQAKQAQVESESQKLAQQSLTSELGMLQAKNTTLKTQLNSTWKSLDINTQNNLTAEQTAWVDKRKAQCQAQSIEGGITDETQVEINRLKCENDQIESRVAEIEPIGE